jgi:hypothetical protein
MAEFVQGQNYTREDVAIRIGLPENKREGGNWVTGYDKWNDEVFIFWGLLDF